MDTGPQQPELPRQRPSSIPSVTVQELEAQCHDLRTLLTATLVALLVFSLGVNLFLGKEQRLIRQKLSESRPTVQRLAAEFRKKEPNMKAFLDALQSYSYTNPDFAPVLERYKAAIPQYFQRTVAVSSMPPGLKFPSNTIPRTSTPPSSTDRPPGP
jgi:hypothetical protein